MCVLGAVGDVERDDDVQVSRRVGVVLNAHLLEVAGRLARRRRRAARPILVRRRGRLPTPPQRRRCRRSVNQTARFLRFLPARRCASAGTSNGPVFCLSVTSRSSIETAEQIELVLGIGASFYRSYTVLNFGCLQNRVLPSGTLSQRKFCFGISIIKTCYRLSSTNVDAQTSSVD